MLLKAFEIRLKTKILRAKKRQILPAVSDNVDDELLDNFNRVRVSSSSGHLKFFHGTLELGGQVCGQFLDESGLLLCGDLTENDQSRCGLENEGLVISREELVSLWIHCQQRGQSLHNLADQRREDGLVGFDESTEEVDDSSSDFVGWDGDSSGKK